MQCMMIRILFTWAVRHPASAYVYGINDLCAPLLLVFISEYILKADEAEKALHVGSKNRKNVKINHVNEDKQKQTEYEPFDGSQI